MDKKVAIRRVRIALSVFFGVLTVALCVLWVRSFWRIEGLVHVSSAGNLVGVISMDGGAAFQTFPYRGLAPGWHLSSEPNTTDGNSSPFIVSISRRMSVVRAPYWMFVITVVCAGFQWIPDRFSLRTLLIATTLVALVLGLSVWLAR